MKTDSTTSTQAPSTLAERGIAPFVARDSGRGLQPCLDDVNRAVYECYGPDLRTNPAKGRLFVDSLFGYERLIRSLAAIPHLDFVTHREAVALPCPSDRIVCAIRHDVDADIRAALAEAEIEREHGVRTSYYVLHTAPYYGAFDNGVFLRNECMAIVYRRIQELGHEIALHTDPLHLYQNLKLDGAEAVRAELAWLRSEGLDVVGTVAHNSAPVYGVENFAIFRGRNRRGLGPDAGDESPELMAEIVHDGKWAPLGVLEEAELGLEYEGNDVFHLGDAPLEYGATRRVNRWRWNAQIKRLRETPDPTEDAFIDQERLLLDIAALPPGRRLMLNVHPLYYGARHAFDSAPPLRVRACDIMVNDALGWETWNPRTLQAEGGAVTPQEYQAINVSDESGMLDAATGCPGDPAALRVLVLGGRNLDGRTVAISEHATMQAAARLTTAGDRAARVRTLAHAGMGLCRHFAWFQAVVAEEKPDVVIIGLGADEIASSLPEHWSRTTGFDPAHPPGLYLRAGDSGVEEIPRSTGAAIRRGPQREDAPAPSLTDPDAATRHADEISRLAACFGYYADAVRAAGATPLALLQECGERSGLWRPGSDADARRAGHARCRETIATWTEAAGVTLADPYEGFLALPPDLPAHWSATSEWNHTGHRVAAAALVLALHPFVKVSGSGSTGGEGT